MSDSLVKEERKHVDVKETNNSTRISAVFLVGCRHLYIVRRACTMLNILRELEAPTYTVLHLGEWAEYSC